MKRSQHVIVVAVALVGGCAGGPRTPGPSAPDSPAAAREWVRTPPPPPESIAAPSRPPLVREWTLRNGLRVVVVEQHRQPIVSVRLIFNAGAVQDPSRDIGATYFAVSLLGAYYEVNARGDRVIEADSFARRVFNKGGEFRSSVTADASFVGIDGYAEDAALYLNLLSKAVRKPRCGPRSFVLRRDAMINALEEVELSDELVFQVFVDRLAFGAGHPYARPTFGTIDSLKRLPLDSVKNRQQRLLTPRGSTLLIVGDVRAGRILVDAKRAFERWPSRRPPPTKRIRPPRISRTNRVLLIPRAPAKSMAICAARPLSDVAKKDGATTRVLTRILGDGLDSRLGVALRMDRGLSYGMYAVLLEKRHARALVACTRVRADDTAAALTAFRSALTGLISKPPTPTELRRAKRQLTTRSATRFGTLSSSVQAWLEALELGHQRPENEVAQIERVTAANVHTLAKKILDPTSVRFILGGTARQARRAVRKANLGRIERVRLDL